MKGSSLNVEADRWRREERANTLTHGLGLAGAAAVTPLLVVRAAGRGDAADIAAAAVFGASLVLLYLASTAYHAIRSDRAREVMRRIDHAAIYVLIAGTYTPFALGVLRGGWGWTLFGVIWGLAAIGVTIKLALGARGGAVSTGVYLAMGWLVLVAIGPVTSKVALPGVAWLVAGGLFYSLGVAFYASSRRYAHAIWHLFVLGGSCCHVLAVFGYAI